MLTVARLLEDAWGIARRERDLILRIAGPLVFLPNLAVLLLLDPLPMMPRSGSSEAAVTRWMAALEAWADGNGAAYLLAAGIALFGQAGIAILLLSRGRRTVGHALQLAAKRLPRFLIAGLIANLLTGIGFLALIVPGLILYARFALIVPVIANERQGALASIVTSVQVTRGATIAILGALAAAFVAQWLAVAPLAPLDLWLRGAGGGHPVAVTLVAMAVAAIETAHALAVLLIGVAAYARLASRGT
jgi:hypothetical protein